MPPVIHITTNGITFKRNASRYILILSSPDAEELKGLAEGCFLYGILVTHDDGSVVEIVDFQILKNEEIISLLNESRVL